MHVHVEVSYDVLHMHVKMDYLHAFNPNEEWSGYCFIYDACICNKEQLQSTFCYMFNSVSFWIFWTRSFLAIGVGVMVLRINIFTYLSCVIFPLLLLFYDQYRIKFAPWVWRWVVCFSTYHAHELRIPNSRWWFLAYFDLLVKKAALLVEKKSAKTFEYGAFQRIWFVTQSM